MKTVPRQTRSGPQRTRKATEEPAYLIIAHSHWDRAWYWPFERFRIKLIECWQQVIALLREHPEYCFMTDGQTLMLEDYLEVCPEDAAFLQEAARTGRLRLGPMYCLADLYCTGGEALIRNIQLGLRFAHAFGGEEGTQRTLHMPDTFGITPSVPMIAAGFGLRAFTFMRGVPGQVPAPFSMDTLEAVVDCPVRSSTRFFTWYGADGSKVRAIRLRDGYGNAARLGKVPGRGEEVDEAAAVEQLLEAAAKQDDGAGPPFLLMAGSDHQIPQAGLPGWLKAASERAGRPFVFAGLDEAAEALQTNPRAEEVTYQGEFHGSGSASVLGGTITTRVYLKQENARIERLLVGAVEPAMALARLMGIDEPATRTAEATWKRLLMTHAHDDICGCSVDPVHRDNEQQMASAAASADALRRRLMHRFAEMLGGNRHGDARFSFFLVNTQVNARTVRTRVRVDFEGRERFGDSAPPEHYAIVDEAGNEVPFRELYRGRGTEHPHPVLDLELEPALPPMRFGRFYVEARRRWPRTPMADKHVLENAHLRAEVRTDGSLTLKHKGSGRTYKGLGLFSGQADAGDSYDFADIPGEKEALFDDRKFRVRALGGCSGLQAIEVSGTLGIPESFSSGGRSTRIVSLPVKVVYSLGPESREVECRLQFTNTARDHRLRWNCPLPFKPAESRAGLKFNELVRPSGKRPRGKSPPRVFPEHPGDHYVAAEDRQGGLAVFAEFPFNYELVPGRPHRLAIALMRAVGYLCRPKPLSTRQNAGAGPHTLVPEAQCLGRAFDLRFALHPFAPEERTGVFAAATRWRAPVLHGQIEAFHPARPAEAEDAEPASALASETPLMLSAFKEKSDRTGVCLRLFNPTAKLVTAPLSAPGVAELTPVDLDEQPTGAQPIQRDASGSFPVSIPPYGLATFALERG